MFSLYIKKKLYWKLNKPNKPKDFDDINQNFDCLN